ncbi:NitT/TauT family transport system substrate-binding protein [Herbaspirillum sp. Sphag1AN]|uniref:ABC transporter substrate-binding protein n=1 Tax=unclassified Herbaspirillum TaxID=2624150 RepID=UPI00161610BD|nr:MULTISPECIES: ABC transporter substrate-binding protein [unclassified Herbaspirillum]MBB3213820.1 NitT/TauT family transport system substrate-binding protein [Herbaspirillum sp. Sphag1AN]MBB3247017.1 NitT/TauT family transport system substrate-binding protein [Herbaspirillum sp. Sphag64]
MESRTMKSLRSVLGVSLMTAACVAAPHAFAAEKAVVYQAFQSIQYLPLYVAIDEGLFTKNGLDVQKITAGSGAQGVAAVIGGHGDFSLQDPMTAVLANLKGAALTNVAMIVSGVPVWMVAPPNSPIKSLADVKDQTVSTAIPPSTSTYLLQNLLKEKGMSSVKLNTVAIGTEIAPVTAGRAAAATMYQPQVEQALASGYKIVYDFAKQYDGVYAFSTIDTLKSTLEKRPQMVQSFVTAIAEAEKLMQTNPQVAYRVAVQEFPSLEKSVVEAAVKRLLDQKIYPANPSISKQAFQAGLDLQISIGNIKAGEVTYESAVNNSFAEKASKP